MPQNFRVLAAKDFTNRTKEDLNAVEKAQSSSKPNSPPPRPNMQDLYANADARLNLIKAGAFDTRTTSPSQNQGFNRLRSSGNN